MEETHRPREKRVIRSIAFPETLSRTIRELADRQHRSVNNTIEMLVVMGLEELKKERAA